MKEEKKYVQKVQNKQMKEGKKKKIGKNIQELESKRRKFGTGIENENKMKKNATKIMGKRQRRKE